MRKRYNADGRTSLPLHHGPVLNLHSLPTWLGGTDRLAWFLTANTKPQEQVEHSPRQPPSPHTRRGGTVNTSQQPELTYLSFTFLRVKSHNKLQVSLRHEADEHARPPSPLATRVLVNDRGARPPPPQQGRAPWSAGSIFLFSLHARGPQARAGLVKIGLAWLIKWSR